MSWFTCSVHIQGVSASDHIVSESSRNKQSQITHQTRCVAIRVFKSRRVCLLLLLPLLVAATPCPVCFRVVLSYTQAMFKFLRRVSTSFLPRPDRPWREDGERVIPAGSNISTTNLSSLLNSYI